MHGHYNLSAAKVHSHATQLLQVGRLQAQPSWYRILGSAPPSEILVRQPQRKIKSRSKKASRMFQPVRIQNKKEDNLRYEFFNDHPWELARPRVVLEADGRDNEKWDWSHPLARPEPDERNSPASRSRIAMWDAKQVQQASRPLNGEAVIQRQKWLMQFAGLKQDAAYDKARKELYSARHSQEIANRVAREEAMFYGGIHGMSLLDVSMNLEDKAYEHWRAWAVREIARNKANVASRYSGDEVDQDTLLESGFDDSPDMNMDTTGTSEQESQSVV